MAVYETGRYGQTDVHPKSIGPQPLGLGPKRYPSKIGSCTSHTKLRNNNSLPINKRISYIITFVTVPTPCMRSTSGLRHAYNCSIEDRKTQKNKIFFVFISPEVIAPFFRAIKLGIGTEQKIFMFRIKMLC